MAAGQTEISGKYPKYIPCAGPLYLPLGAVVYIAPALSGVYAINTPRGAFATPTHHSICICYITARVLYWIYMTEPEGVARGRGHINQYCTSARDITNLSRMKPYYACAVVQHAVSTIQYGRPYRMLQVARHFSLLTRNQNRLESLLVVARQCQASKESKEVSLWSRNNASPGYSEL